ncbi:MAG: NAD(P)H-binding protein [Pseudomonadota bacterium]
MSEVRRPNTMRARARRGDGGARRRQGPPQRIGLVGATGLIGRTLIEISSAGDVARMVGISRREIDMPKGARMELFVAQADKWGEVLAAVRPRSLICALGTTWNKAGKTEEGFRAVDQDLIVETARVAKEAGISNFVLVSSAGADLRSKNFYLKVKGETEALVTRIGFKRLDILQPGLLRGTREADWRVKERLAIALSPVIDPLLPTKYAAFRSVEATLVAQAALGLAMRRASGRFTHDNEAMRRAARDWRSKAEQE